MKKLPQSPKALKKIRKMKLSDAIRALQSAGIEDPEFDARELFAEIAGFQRHALVSRDAESDDPRLISAIERRMAREPLQYIIGKTGFYREVYKVNADCLIPRQDTEILVDYAVKNIPQGESFIDMCTGSGCVAISTLSNTRDTRALALDISDGALSVARRNAEKNGVSDRIEFAKQDVLGFIPEEKVYAILSNPPYVTDSEYESLESEIYHEPKIAFVGGKDGLDFYKKIIPNVKNSIKQNGFLAFEIGKDQAEALNDIADESCMDCLILKDFSDLPRVAVFRNKK